MKDGFRNAPSWPQTVSAMARHMTHTTRRQLELPCPTPAPQFCHHYPPPPCRASLRRHYMLVSYVQTTWDYCTWGCGKHCALAPAQHKTAGANPMGRPHSCCRQLPLLSACSSYPRMAAHLILRLLLVSGKSFEVWSKRTLISVCNLWLWTNDAYYVHQGGWVLQVQFTNLEVFLSWTSWTAAMLAAESRLVPCVAWSETDDSSTEADKALIIWLQRRKCRHRVDLLNKK